MESHMTEKPEESEAPDENSDAGADERTSTGAALAKWFAENPPEGKSTPEELAERIREIREGWD